MVEWLAFDVLGGDVEAAALEAILRELAETAGSAEEAEEEFAGVVALLR